MRKLASLTLSGLGLAGILAARSKWLARNGGVPAADVATTLGMGRLGRTTELAKVGAKAGASFVAHKAQVAVANDERKVELEAAYELKTAEQVAETLGNMKGVLMKLGQMASFVNEGFPEQLREQLAVLQADAPPMSAELAAGVIKEELGSHPSVLFAEWDPKPLAAASIGQVHKARLHDGRAVAVKVQYPGVEKAIKADLANTSMLTSMMGVVFKGLDVGPFIAELKDRVSEELDYKLEASRQQKFAEIFAGHPTIKVPNVLPELSTARVLTTELSEGVRFADTVDWPQADRDLAAETIYRFVFRSFNRHQIFNGDPTPRQLPVRTRWTARYSRRLSRLRPRQRVLRRRDGDVLEDDSLPSHRAESHGVPPNRRRGGAPCCRCSLLNRRTHGLLRLLLPSRSRKSYVRVHQRLCPRGVKAHL